MENKGRLIVIDGTDASGKKTQTQRLVERFRAEGRDVETLDFPRYKNNFFGALLRECLDGKRGDWAGTNPRVASTIYACDRWESLPEINGWLAAGKMVVLDRYVSSNQIHQAGKIHDDKEREEFLIWLDKMEHDVLGLPRPDLIIYLDVPLDITQRLMKERLARENSGHVESQPDQHEGNPQHLRDAQESGLKMIASRNNWKRIDCSDGNDILPIEAVHEKVWEALRDV